ncbi:hypothetical protein BHM03_00046054, partial [Ensete ventricosum]
RFRLPAESGIRICSAHVAATRSPVVGPFVPQIDASCMFDDAPATGNPNRSGISPLHLVQSTDPLKVSV